jgi:hypothetical protein
MAARISRQPIRLVAEDEEHLRAGIEAAERGETRPLTREELDRWVETGELPEHLDPCHPSGPRSSAT